MTLEDGIAVKFLQTRLPKALEKYPKPGSYASRTWYTHTLLGTVSTAMIDLLSLSSLRAMS